MSTHALAITFNPFSERSGFSQFASENLGTLHLSSFDKLSFPVKDLVLSFEGFNRMESMPTSTDDTLPTNVTKQANPQNSIFIVAFTPTEGIETTEDPYESIDSPLYRLVMQYLATKLKGQIDLNDLPNIFAILPNNNDLNYLSEFLTADFQLVGINSNHLLLKWRDHKSLSQQILKERIYATFSGLLNMNPELIESLYRLRGDRQTYNELLSLYIANTYFPGQTIYPHSNGFVQQLLDKLDELNIELEKYFDKPGVLFSTN